MDAFRRSSFCASGNCLEIGPGGGGLAIRGREPDTVLVVRSARAWREFVRAVKRIGRGSGSPR